MSNHRILIVNDDGIEAQGLAELEAIARQYSSDVWVVAPDEERSGASHAISLSIPIRVRQLAEKRFAVKGTPADCVILAVWELMRGERPTLVLSGINHGENLGDDMLYSGTTGAAIEAALLGISCVAFSQVRRNFGKADFSLARRYGPALLGRVVEADVKQPIFLNINFPNSPGDISGVAVVPNGRRAPGTFKPLSGLDGRNVPYFWTKVTYDSSHVPSENTDLAGIRDGRITITPLDADITAHRQLGLTRAMFKDVLNV